MHLSHTNARGFVFLNAREADASAAESHRFQYRGVSCEITRCSRPLVICGGRLIHALDFDLTITVPGGAPTDVESQTGLASIEEAAAFIVGHVDALVREAPVVVTLPASPRPGESEYRRLQRRYHQLGREIYGAEWDEVRAQHVIEYTRGDEHSSTALEGAELVYFIARYERQAAGGTHRALAA